MSESFNPYHSWLGIPADELPPNHYRLLGVPLFETNEDVIQNGLDQRMTHVKSFAAGPHAAESQRLLTELSQAGVCLLRPEKKQSYDQQLRSELESPGTATTPGLLPPPVPPQPAPSASPGHLASSFPSKPRLPIIPAVVGTVAGLSVAVIVILVVSTREPADREIATNDPPDHNSRLGEDPNGTDPAPDPDPATVENGNTNPIDPEPVQPPPDVAAPDPVEPPPTPTPPTENRTQPVPSPFETTNVPPPSWPEPLPGSPTMNQSPLPSTPLANAPDQATPTPTRSLTGEKKSIVLDLERSAMYVTLAENAKGKDVQAQVQTIRDLGTEYQLQPNHGIVNMGQPVDVLLTQYPGVKISLSMHMKGENAELQVAPEIETEQGKTSDFSNRKLNIAERALVKNAKTLTKQLAAAQAESQLLEKALRQPAPITVRNAQRQRHSLLTKQTIPALQSQLVYVQTRGDVLRQLALLAKQIHEKATFDLTVQAHPAASTP